MLSVVPPTAVTLGDVPGHAAPVPESPVATVVGTLPKYLSSAVSPENSEPAHELLTATTPARFWAVCSALNRLAFVGEVASTRTMLQCGQTADTMSTSSDSS